MTAFHAGELVTITIKAATVLAVDTDQDGYRDLAVETADDRRLALVTVPLDHQAVTVERLAPADWPPQPGDLWRDKHGDLWFTYLGHDDGSAQIMMRTADGLRWSEGYEGQVADNGPWTLVHREPAGGESGA